MYGLIKAIELKTSRVFKFVSKTTLFSMLLSFILMIDLYVFIAAVIAQVFNPTEKHAIPAPSNKATARIKTYLLTAETKSRRCPRLTFSFGRIFVFKELTYYLVILFIVIKRK